MSSNSNVVEAKLKTQEKMYMIPQTVEQEMATISTLTKEVVSQALMSDGEDRDSFIPQKLVKSLAELAKQTTLGDVDLGHVQLPHFLRKGAIIADQLTGVSEIVFNSNTATIVARGDRTAHILEILHAVSNASHAYRLGIFPENVEMIRIRRQESVHFRPLKVERSFLQIVCLKEVLLMEGELRGALDWLYLGGTKVSKVMTAGRIHFWAGKNR